jgi:hypothetical protein
MPGNGRHKVWKKACQHGRISVNFIASVRPTAPSDEIIMIIWALVAQGIEQRIPNPCAAGSIPAGGTIDILHKI